MKRSVIYFLLSVVLLFGPSVKAEVVTDAHTQVQLVSTATSIQSGKAVWIGLHMKMDDDWHVYWKNPGDSGLAPKIKWVLPQGFSAGDIQWPYPVRINVGPLTGFGYEGEVVLFSEVQVPEGLNDGDNVVFKGRVDWLACKVECIPGRADLNLTLPVQNAAAQPDPKWALVFAHISKRWPVVSDAWNVRFYDDGRDLRLIVTSLKGQRTLSGFHFFPEREDLIDHAATQEITDIPGGAQLRIKKSSVFPKNISNVRGIIVNPEGWSAPGQTQALLVDAPIEAAAIVSVSSAITLVSACLFAFVGGLILNLMPCVLPVLSLKIIGLLKHVSHRREMFLHGLCFTAGVLVSFWALAGVLIGLKLAGQQVGWGFQFQSPLFVIFIAGVLFILALNLFGVFEVGNSLTSVGGSLPKGGRAGSFWGGVLATVVATPCTAPFMGTALGFALAQPVPVAFLVFTFLGLGMAAPYLFLSAFPRFLKWIPKPGGWMIGLKTFLGFVLAASVIWLVWVLGLQRGIHAVGLFLSGLLFLGMGSWVVGLIQQDRMKWFHMVSLAVFFILGLMLAAAAAFVPVAGPTGSVENARNGIFWQKFSDERVEEAIKNGGPVFIDFTAAWCLTCQVNDRLVFQDKSVVNAFNEFGVMAFKADWTNHDEAITKALARYGKNSIPLYVFYSGTSQEPVILPELVTPGSVIEMLKKHLQKH